ncbi:hypothetical protein ACC706_37100, partial [Rhizobium johnstonii]
RTLYAEDEHSLIASSVPSQFPSALATRAQARLQSSSVSTVRRSHREGNLPHHREHVNEYFTDRTELLKIGQLEVPPAKISPELRLT